MTPHERRQAVVQLDGLLTVIGVFKAAVGFGVALYVGAWLHAWMAGVFALAALLLIRGLYWPTVLALIGAAYADSPVRDAFGVELSSFPLMAVQALVAVPLWLAAMDYPEKLQGRARRAAWACCVTAFLAGIAAPLFPPGAYWLVAAPLALAALPVLLYRMWKYRVPFGTRGWLCCGSLLPAALVVCSELFLPGTRPILERVALWVNLWLSVGPVALVVLYLGGSRRGTDSKTDPRVGPPDRRVPRRKRDEVQRERAGVVGDLLPSLRSTSGVSSSLSRIGAAGPGEEACGDRRVATGRWGRWGRPDGRGPGQHDAGDGPNDSLRPAPEEVGREFGTDPLRPAKVAR